MKSKMAFAILAILSILACSAPFTISLESTPPNPMTATSPPASNTAIEPTSTGIVISSPSASSTSVAVVPSATDTQPPPASFTPSLPSTPASGAAPGAAGYVDDRSTPSQVIVSYFNAVNRREYARAYGYWRDPASSLGSFSSFAAGYSDTASVDLVFGQINGDQGMSQVHDVVPVILKVNSNTRTQ